MSSKKRLLKQFRLYVIIDKDICSGRSLYNVAGRLNHPAGVIIQYRDKRSPKGQIIKNALSLRKLIRGNRALFIVNDYPDVAMIAGADGIHLGQDDTPIETARRLLGRDKIIGISCHSLSQAIQAQERGADYIGIGPVFKTATKPLSKKEEVGLALLKEIRLKIKIPFFAIGGINPGNIQAVLASGVERVAVCSAVCRARNIRYAVKNFSRILNS